MRTLLMLHTARHLNTHSIDRLLRCCTLCCAQLPDLFPQPGDMDRRLFGLLQKAYIDARYGKEYRIWLDEVTVLTERIKGLQTVLHAWKDPYLLKRKREGKCALRNG